MAIFFFTSQKDQTVDATDLGKLLYENLDRAGIDVYDNNIAEVPWEECTHEYQQMMIQTAKTTMEALYGDGWRLVQLRDWLGCYMVKEEYTRVPPMEDD